jgi:hypothetical protein
LKNMGPLLGGLEEEIDLQGPDFLENAGIDL